MAPPLTGSSLIAWAFVVWVIIVTALGHPFWTMEGVARAVNQANFYKNLAIMAAYLSHRFVRSWPELT
jgi:uncharacterized membrane protein YphA (DoxX/SURF4 family)